MQQKALDTKHGGLLEEGVTSKMVFFYGSQINSEGSYKTGVSIIVQI
jgi:hypothetical protein